jgi:hypothetical protein
MSIKSLFLDTSKHDRLTATQQDKRMEVSDVVNRQAVSNYCGHPHEQDT